MYIPLILSPGAWSRPRHHRSNGQDFWSPHIELDSVRSRRLVLAEQLGQQGVGPHNDNQRDDNTFNNVKQKKEDEDEETANLNRHL